MTEIDFLCCVVFGSLRPIHRFWHFRVITSRLNEHRYCCKFVTLVLISSECWPRVIGEAAARERKKGSWDWLVVFFGWSWGRIYEESYFHVCWPHFLVYLLGAVTKMGDSNSSSRGAAKQSGFLYTCNIRELKGRKEGLNPRRTNMAKQNRTRENKKILFRALRVKSQFPSERDPYQYGGVLHWFGSWTLTGKRNRVGMPPVYTQQEACFLGPAGRSFANRFPSPPDSAGNRQDNQDRCRIEPSKWLGEKGEIIKN